MWKLINKNKSHLPRLPYAIKLAAMLSLTLALLITQLLSPLRISLTGFIIILLATSIWHFHDKKIFLLILSLSIICEYYSASNNIPSESSAWQYTIILLPPFAALILISTILFKFKITFKNLREQIETDELTGLKNRRGFLSASRYEIHRSNRYQQPLTIAVLDLDNFKKINDSKGHSVGDKLLIELGSYLRSALRKVDTVARMGGDEIVFMFPNTNADEAEKAIARLHENLLNLLQSYDEKLNCSIGAVSFSPRQNHDISLILQEADNLMYHTKRVAKKRFTVKDLTNESFADSALHI